MTNFQYFIVFCFILTSFTPNSFLFIFDSVEKRNNRSFVLVESVWTLFDLVRPEPNKWGSNATTPFFRIERPYSNTTYFNGQQHVIDTGADAKFGYSVANIGDIDGNGIDDIAVGAIGETVGNHTNAGGVYIFLMNSTGGYNHYHHINGLHSGEPKLTAGDQFGYSLATIGDLNNDGITELAVGAPGIIISSVYILYLYGDGTVRNYQLIRGKYINQIPDNSTIPSNSSIIINNSTTTLPLNFNESYIPNGPPIEYGSRFGSSLACLGETDHNYYITLAVSLSTSRGVTGVFLLYLNATGWVKTSVLLTPSMAGIDDAFSNFGSSITILPKISKADPLYMVAIGASRKYEPGTLNIFSGMVYIFYMDGHGKVNRTTVISESSSLSSNGFRLPFEVKLFNLFLVWSKFFRCFLPLYYTRNIIRCLDSLLFFPTIFNCFVVVL
jgi:hypothetical protein